MFHTFVHMNFFNQILIVNHQEPGVWRNFIYSYRFPIKTFVNDIIHKLDKVLFIFWIVIWFVTHVSYIPSILKCNCSVTLAFDLEGQRSCFQ